MKLALGTAQFGFDYGIGNPIGKISDDEAALIIDQARGAGVDTLDTAVSYGDSESRLGLLGVQDWKIISKIPPLPSTEDNFAGWVMQQVCGSIQRMAVKQLDGLLLHQPSDILGCHGIAYLNLLRGMKAEGLIRSIGFSIYSPSELYPLLSVFKPDIVQVPYSIIDRRIVTTGWMQKLSDMGIRIHTRSTFLQGLLLIPDESKSSYFNRWNSLWKSLNEICTQLKLSPLELSLGYVLAQAAIERVVVGVDSFMHMKQIINAARLPVLEESFSELNSEDVELIEPYRWRLK